MGDIDNDWEPPRRCCDCGAPVNEDHHAQGFGHQFRCCACYEKRQRNEKEARRG